MFCGFLDFGFLDFGSIRWFHKSGMFLKIARKLKWKYEPFQIPRNLLNEWKMIGNKACEKAQKHEAKYKKITNNHKVINSQNL